MKRLITLITVLFWSAHIFAQCVILDIPLGGCVSCRNNVYMFKGLPSKLPVFAVFKESQRADSAEVEYQLNLNELKIKYIFNDKAYKKYHIDDNEASWYLIDHNGETVIKEKIKKVSDYPFVDSVNKLVSSLPGEKHNMYHFTNTQISIYRPDIEKLQILSKYGLKPIAGISAMNLDYAYLTQSLKGIDSVIFAEKGATLNKNIRGLRPGFKWFSVNSKEEYYGMLEYMQTFLVNKDTVSYKPNICMVQYDSVGNIKKVFQFDNGKVKKHDIYQQLFACKDDNSFIAVTHDPSNWFADQLKINPNQKIEFITKYIIDTVDGTVKFANLYPFDLPLAYKKKYFDNCLNTLSFSYPYMSFDYANELYNLSTLKSCSIIDTLTYKAGINFTTKELNREKYQVLTVGSLKKKDEAFVIYRLGDDVYIKTFKDMKEVRQVCIGNILLNNHVHVCFVDPYAEQVYFTFESEANGIALPLSLFGI